MPKTKRDLIFTLADRIGGERGRRMKAAFETPLLKDLKAWDEIVNDEEFESQLKRLGQNVGKAVDLKELGWPDSPESWGFN